MVPPSVKFKKKKKSVWFLKVTLFIFSHFPFSFVLLYGERFFFLIAYLDNVSSVQSNVVVFFSLILKLKKKKGML